MSATQPESLVVPDAKAETEVEAESSNNSEMAEYKGVDIKDLINNGNAPLNVVVNKLVKV